MIGIQAKFHVLISALFSLPFFFSGNYLGGFLFFVAGVFIDFDHEVDYYVLYGKFTLNPYDLATKLREEHFFCPLHSWELCLLAGIISLEYVFLTGLFYGWLLHLILDMFTNNMTPQLLSLVYRIRNGFERETLEWM